MAENIQPQNSNHVTKRCCHCRVEKSVADFGVSRGHADGLKTACKECRNRDNKAAYYRDLDASRKKTADRARRRYAADPVAAAAKALAWSRKKRAELPQKPEPTEEEIAAKAADCLRQKREARKRTYEKNKTRVLAVSAIYRAGYKDREMVVRRAHYQRNKTKVAEITKAYREAHPEVYSAAFARRRAAKLKATPPWADRARMDAIYAEAARVTAETGVLHEVDHIVPLQGKHVCGLHCEENLQIITQYENRSKSNKWSIAA